MYNQRFSYTFILGLVCLLAISLLVGCGQSTALEQSGDNVAQEGIAVNGGELEGKFPVTFLDGAGEEVTIEAEPTSIISVIPSNTEIVYALGAGEKMVGRSNYCNYPEEVLDVEEIGAMDLDVEKILALQPDVALLSMHHHRQNGHILDQFRAAGITVVVVNNEAKSFEDVYASIRLVAQATGASEKAEEVIQDMQEHLAQIKARVASVTEKKKVWIEVSPAPNIVTTGKDTFMHYMLEMIQAINVAGDEQGWPQFVEEEIVRLNPDVIITTYGFYVDNPAHAILNRSGWSQVEAIKNKQVFDVHNDTVTRPGPRLMDGVETLAKFIYPQIFEE